MNCFNFIVIWTVKDGRENNEKNSYLDREKKGNERNLVKYIVNTL